MAQNTVASKDIGTTATVAVSTASNNTAMTSYNGIYPASTNGILSTKQNMKILIDEIETISKYISKIKEFF